MFKEKLQPIEEVGEVGESDGAEVGETAKTGAAIERIQSMISAYAYIKTANTRTSIH